MNTRTDFEEDEAERTLRYWNAAISCLSTPEKRAVAEEFLRRKLDGGGGADTLFALILLLEANGALLRTLPEQFRNTLIEPLSAVISGFHSEFQAQIDGQRQAARSIGLVHDEIEIASKTIRQTSSEFEAKIQAAVREINVSDVAGRICGAIESSTLTPMQATLRDLNERTSKMERASASAEQSIETWHKVHFGGIVTNCVVGVLIFALVLVSAIAWQIHGHYREKLAAEVDRLGANDEAQQKLTTLGIGLRVASWVDSDGKAIRDGYAIIIENAEQVDLKETDGRKKAVAFVKDRSVRKRVDEIREALEIRRALPVR